MDPLVGAVLVVAFVVALVKGVRYLSRPTPRRSVRDEPDPSDSAGA